MIEGLGDVLKAFGRAAAMKATADRLTRETVERIAAGQRAAAPKGPEPHEGPDLAESFEVTREGLARYAITNRARQALPMEYGTYKDAPQPYFWQPVDREVPRLMAMLHEAATDL